MPDHVHVLLSAVTDSAEPLRCFEAWKQWTGYHWRQACGDHLWQQGYWDYVLRDDDDVRGVASYIVNNPVRAGLVSCAADYPYVGSAVHSVTELMDAAQWRPPRRRG